MLGCIPVIPSFSIVFFPPVRERTDINEGADSAEWAVVETLSSFISHFLCLTLFGSSAEYFS